MEAKTTNISRMRVQVLDICLDYSEKNKDEDQESINKLSKGWDAILAEKGKIDNAYFGIIVSSGEVRLGIIIKKDNLYLQGIFNVEEVEEKENGEKEIVAYIYNRDIRYKDCQSDNDKFICPDFIFDAVKHGNDCIKGGEDKIYSFFHSCYFSRLIFVVSEAARLESVRISLDIGIVMYNFDEKLRMKVASEKNLYNVSKNMVMNELLNFDNYNDLKKSYEDIISHGKVSKEKEKENFASIGFASISMSQAFLGSKYTGKNRVNQNERKTYEKIGLLKENSIVIA